MVRRIGTPDDDVFEGTPGNDEFFGRGGDDLSRSGAGRDRLFGELGNDELEGGDGRDFLVGGLGDDRLDGRTEERSARDVLLGGAGADTIVGGDGDAVSGGTGDDRLFVIGGEASGGRGADLFALGDIVTPQTGTVAVVFGDARISDFEPGTDRINVGAYEETASGAFAPIAPSVAADTLDSNDDGLVGAGDVGVTMRGGGLRIDFEQVFDEVPYVPGENSVTLVGVRALDLDDFAGLA